MSEQLRGSSCSGSYLRRTELCLARDVRLFIYSTNFDVSPRQLLIFQLDDESIAVQTETSYDGGTRQTLWPIISNKRANYSISECPLPHLLLLTLTLSFDMHWIYRAGSSSRRRRPKTKDLGDKLVVDQRNKATNQTRLNLHAYNKKKEKRAAITIDILFIYIYFTLGIAKRCRKQNHKKA